jgi:YVTN family beta-propeller protein
LSSDGTALYVGNYGENSLAVVDVAAMKVVQKIATGPMPIGVAFEPLEERVWVSCYGGSVRIYDSKNAKPHKSVSMLKDEAKRFPP